MLSAGQQYIEEGFCEGTFSKSDMVWELRKVCESFVNEQLGQKVSLNQYHKHVTSEEQHRELHYELTQVIQKSQLHKNLVLQNLNHFQHIVGPDIDLQAVPYLRISRPGIKEDNIGLHRDTFYGNTAYEVSCIVPLEDFTKGAAVNVMPKSQNLGPLDFERLEHETITKGSKQNQIGFLYATKKIKNLDRSKLYAPLMKVGDYMMFSLCMIHGQEKNTSGSTRWSIDFRFRNSFSPLNVNLKDNYYTKLVSSAASQLADQYYANNPLDVAEFTNSTNKKEPG
jgi:sporadic carbohydrate cluster 2OG-Fe(II) oxygenase